MARKARPKKCVIPTPTGAWGDGPPLTAEEQARVWGRYGNMRIRGFRFGFRPLVQDGWVEATTPEELVEGTRRLLEERLRGKPVN